MSTSSPPPPPPLSPPPKLLLYYAPCFCISSATLTFNDDQTKLLLTKHSKLATPTGFTLVPRYSIPRGRKAIDETFEAAASRYTYEQTGYEIQLQPRGLATAQGVPEHDIGAWRAAGLTVPFHTEAIAVSERDVAGVREICFWNIGERVDRPGSRAEGLRRLGDGEVLERGEKIEGAWVDVREAEGLLTHEDKLICKRAFEALELDLDEDAGGVAIDPSTK